MTIVSAAAICRLICSGGPRLAGGLQYANRGALTAGQVYRAEALIHPEQSTARVVAETDATVFTITRAAFRAAVMKGQVAGLEEYVNFIGEVEHLKSLSLDERRAVAQALEEVVCESGDCVIREGEEGEHMYFVYHGELDAIMQGSRGGVVVESYTPGGYFGEGAVLT